MAQPEIFVSMQFSESYYGKSVTDELPSTLHGDEDVDAVGESGYGALPSASSAKSGNVVRQLQHCYTPEDRAPSAYYRMVATSFPYASKVSKFSGQVTPPSYCKVLPAPGFALPSSAVESFCDASMFNLTSMIEDYMHYAQNVMVVVQTGLDFVKDADSGMRMWTERQTDLSECYNASIAVAHACASFTQAKFKMEVFTLRAKTGFATAMRGHGIRHDVEMYDDLEVPGELNYGDDDTPLPTQADETEARQGHFPQGPQAFSHPRIVRSVDALCLAIKTSYEIALLRAWQARDRLCHLLSIIEGPHGSVFRSMAEHAIISTLTSWMRTRHAYHATLHPLDTIVVDTDLTHNWKLSVEDQWRAMPELLDELAVHMPRGVGAPLRMPPAQMLMRLKLAYDFEGVRMYRSLLTHSDAFHMRMHMRSLQNETAMRVFEPTPSGLRLSVEKSQKLDPWRQQARFMLVPNGLFMNHVFNEDTVCLLMNALPLPSVMCFLRSSRVLYMLGSRFAKYWVFTLNRFLIHHKQAYPVLGGDDIWTNIFFRDATLPRKDSIAFDAHYAPFYEVVCTLSSLARTGTYFCVFCLKESCRRSKLFRMQPICNVCYEKNTVTQSKLLAAQGKNAKVEWYRCSDMPRTQLSHVLEFRPQVGRPYHMETVYNKDDYTLLMMQMHNMSLGLSPQLHADDAGHLRIAPQQESVEVRYLIGGPHAQLREPMKVQLCYNYHKYAGRQYGVDRTLIKDGHNHYAISRFLGSYCHRRTRELFDMTKDVIVARLDASSKPDDFLYQDVTFPLYDSKMRALPEDRRVYRVNKPFRVLTAFDGTTGTPSRYCQVVATHLRVDGTTSSETAHYPLCDACMRRAYEDGMNGIMDEDDSMYDDSDSEQV